MKTTEQPSGNGETKQPGAFSWDRETETWLPQAEVERKRQKRRKGRGPKWVIVDYQALLELGRATDNALLIVLAELYRLYYQAWEKAAPIPFGQTEGLRKLKVKSQTRRRMLNALEAAGWIRVEWQRGKSPRVVFRKGFHLMHLYV